MKRIVDQYGKPFKPKRESITEKVERLLAPALPIPVIALQDAPQPCGWEAQIRISQLRESCGAPPASIIFRRSTALKGWTE